ncbi:hypothetical protein BB559_002198 [Furculomyces boomerangus]|uniref:Complex III subunit 9 n=2 Tax=Harpellales TaxID=61421 RepID=A0A2T9YXA5_9FUNG|nr:hypothetical protein BB559_002198 [Furculomyces boomerangus]PVZ99548.1 hypothetical protein BB558_004440 [Smittium angustum]
MARYGSSPIFRSLYTSFFKKESRYFTVIVLGGFAFSLTFNKTFDKYWDATHPTQWKDVKHRFIKDE